MTFYEPRGAEGFECVNTFEDGHYEVFRTLDGRALSSTWRSFSVRLVSADNRQTQRLSDFPWLGSYALVMRERAVEFLSGILKNHGELLPLETDDGVRLFVFNCKIVNALNEAGSIIQRFPGTDRIMRVKKVMFVEDEVKNLDMFRLPYRLSPTWVSDRFVKHYCEAGLRGLTFKEVT